MKHYTLYYLFREDQARHPLSPEADRRIHNAITRFWQNRPPGAFESPSAPVSEETEYPKETSP